MEMVGGIYASISACLAYGKCIFFILGKKKVFGIRNFLTSLVVLLKYVDKQISYNLSLNTERSAACGFPFSFLVLGACTVKYCKYGVNGKFTKDRRNGVILPCKKSAVRFRILE